jgi:multicomponent Na+:H+ antiporter subunit F
MVFSALNLGLVVILLLMFAVLILFFKQKNILNKIQLANVFNSLIIIIIAIFCYAFNKPEYIDIALLYGVLSYIGVLATSKYLIANLESKEDK